MSDAMSAPAKGKFLCLRDCEGPVRDREGNIEMARTTHEGELRPVRQVFYEGETYEFESVEQMPLKVSPVVKLDESGLPVFMDDPRKRNDPTADLIPVYEFETDQETGRRQVKRKVEGYNHFVRLDNLGNHVPMEDDPMLHGFLVRETVRSRRRKAALTGRGKARKSQREKAFELAAKIQSEAEEVLKREGIG